MVNAIESDNLLLIVNSYQEHKYCFTEIHELLKEFPFRVHWNFNFVQEINQFIDRYSSSSAVDDDK